MMFEWVLPLCLSLWYAILQSWKLRNMCLSSSVYYRPNLLTFTQDTHALTIYTNSGRSLDDVFYSFPLYSGLFIYGGTVAQLLVLLAL